jgi:hypothetical protein
MYSHPIDRYRVGKILLEHEIEKTNMSVQEIADKSLVAATVIYNLKKPKYIERKALAKRNAVRRESLLRILGLGLSLQPKEIDAFLWLYRCDDRFEALTENERRACVDDQYAHLPGCTSVEELRKRVLVGLKEVLNKWRSKPTNNPEIKMVLELTEDEQLDTGRRLLEFEKLPGQRLMIMRYPSHLSHSPEMFDRYIDELINPQVESEEGKKKSRLTKIERREIFLQHLQLYGERCIYTRVGLERYLEKDFPHKLSVEKRRAHIKHTIDLLAKYPDFEIALADAELELEMELKTIGAIMRGAPGDEHWTKKRIVCGPRYIYWHDKASTLSFLLDFEREWDEIWSELPKEQRNKEYVIDQLERMLSGERRQTSSS